MNQFEFSELQDPTHFYPIRAGMQFVCDACPCGETRLFVLGACIVAECEHIVMQIDNSEVIAIHSLGVRQ